MKSLSSLVGASERIAKVIVVIISVSAFVYFTMFNILCTPKHYIISHCNDAMKMILDVHLISSGGSQLLNANFVPL